VLESLSPQRRRLVLVLGALGLALALVVLATVLWTRGSAVRPVPQDRPGPVLLVPGYGGDTASLAPLVAQVEGAGRPAYVVELPDGGTGDLHQQAERLRAVAADAVRDTGSASADVIGYSAGGVVARLWVREHGGAALARRVVSIGSPQHGTSQAALGAQLGGGCPPACRQLAPDSDLLRRLNAGDETPSGPQWVTIRSRTDVVVTPVDSAALDGALNVLVQDVCPGSRADHGDLPADRVTVATVEAALAVELPAPPRAAVC
jgi:triacylglycerol lipase